ncbi:hypothetical protein Poli38472_012290 [Pythium oligandrum]|uniref:Queuosine 5'-phosphate N-glycosylase/hydrolase n=1 Tax=Pythium oligandrum TaxID=41045 RepID=A0A8K1CQ41_PYTOL|nr:hypothetical protein Poli38472_012290 [Pythium oligandrum]|eukprot:TMW67174.1 hypothetical protein Poli38472_012290 [Pythium oligandrum]
MAPSTSESILTRVRRSCAAQVAHEDCAVAVNADKVRAFLDELDWQQYADLAQPQRFPLNFKSLQDEINFLTLYSLLNFGSGFRKDLHKYCDRGAAETILFGLLGMYIDVPRLDAEFMAKISIDVLANYFSLPLDRDEELSTGIYISKPGPLRPFAEMLHNVFTECGQKLQEKNLEDFGAFVLANLHADGSDCSSAAFLVTQLVEAFPAFDDHQVSRGNECFILKRAQLTVGELYRRFHETHPELDFEDIRELTAFSDNVLPCVLRALGILEYSSDLSMIVDSGEELQAGDWECDLRAAAIVACEQIVAESKGRVTTIELDYYLWRVGKDPRFRGLERHATRNTFFY